MAYKVILARDVREVVNRFTDTLRRSWDLRIVELIENPLPRKGVDFEILVTAKNQFGDSSLAYVVDEFPVVILYDVHSWPESEENPLGFIGKVAIWNVSLWDALVDP